MYHDHARWSLLHSSSPQSQRENVPDGMRGSQQSVLQPGSVLSSDQAVEHWVETAVGMGETHSQGEGVRLSVVEGLAEGHQVKLDENPPQGESLVWQPANEKGQNYDGDGAGDFGAAALASFLILRPLCPLTYHAANNSSA